MILNKNPKDILAQVLQEDAVLPLDDFVQRVCLPAVSPSSTPAGTLSQINLLNTLLCHIEDIFHAEKNNKSSESLVDAHVIGVHHSVGSILPVIEIVLPHQLGKIVLRDNHYDCKISFELSQPLPENTFGTIGFFDPARRHDAVYCEGFPENRVHGSFRENTAAFTVSTATLGRHIAEALICGVVVYCREANPVPRPQTQRAQTAATAKLPSPVKKYRL